VEGALIRARIPYIVRGGKGILQTEEVRDILSYIRFATNTKDFSALVRAMGAPKRGIGDVGLEKLRVAANEKHSGDLLEACKAAGTLTGNFCDTIRNIQFKLNHPADAIQSAITDSGYVGYIQKKYEADKARIETKLDNLLRFKDMVRGMMEEAEMTVEDMIFQMTMEKPEADNPSGSVVISTIHSAKGLEWPVVYALNMVEGSLPHRFSLGSEAEIQEERRVWYVAATRPQNRFVICVPDQVMNGKYMVRAKPSRFLVELGLYPEPEE
jgi:superfamily I DNA/RNA helicase